MGLSIDVRQWGSPPKKWEARVQPIPADRGIEAIFRFMHWRKTIVLTEIALKHADGSPLTNVDVQRRHPLASWERAARSAVIERWLESAGRSASGEAEHPSATRIMKRLNEYSAIAAEYRENVKNGLGDPVAEIARQHGVKPSTARGWVYRTRKLGLLGKARGRTSGEL